MIYVFFIKMKPVFLFILLCGCSADTDYSFHATDVSKLEVEVQTLRQMVNQEVQLRLEFEENFLMHIKLLRETKENVMELIDNLMNEASRNISTGVQALDTMIREASKNASGIVQNAEKRVAALERELKNAFRKIKQGKKTVFET